MHNFYKNLVYILKTKCTVTKVEDSLICHCHLTVFKQYFIAISYNSISLFLFLMFNFKNDKKY